MVAIAAVLLRPFTGGVTSVGDDVDGGDEDDMGVVGEGDASFEGESGNMKLPLSSIVYVM